MGLPAFAGQEKSADSRNGTGAFLLKARRELLHGLDVSSLLTLGAGHDFKRHLLAFLEGLEAFNLDCREVSKRSSPPSSGVMKPKPLASLNHLTIPLAISNS